MKYSINNMRLTNERPYYEGHMRVFAEHICEPKQFDEESIIQVCFGKQDIRGGFSITLIDNRHCVPSQKFFNSKDEMLGYLVAYNESKGWYGYDEFNQYEVSAA